MGPEGIKILVSSDPQSPTTIENPNSIIPIVARQSSDGKVFIHMRGGSNREGTPKIDPKRSQNYLFLFLSTFLLFGPGYSYVNPSAFNTALMGPYNVSKEVNLVSDINLLYSSYSFPNILIPIIIGRYLTIYPKYTGIVTILSGATFLLGDLLFVFSIQFSNFPSAIASRVFTGFASDALAICQAYYISRWFGGHKLTLVFGLTYTVANAASFLNYFLTPRVVSWKSATVAAWIGFAPTILTFLVCCGIAYMDKIYDPTEQKEIKELQSGFIRSTVEVDPYADGTRQKPRDNVEMDSLPTVLKNKNLSLGTPTRLLGDTSRSHSALYIPESPNVSIVDKPLSGTRISIEEFVAPTSNLWKTATKEITFETYLVMFAYISYMISYYSFTNIFPTLLVATGRYGQSAEDAGTAASLVPLVVMFATPVVGKLADYYTANARFLSAGCVMLVVLHFLILLPVFMTGTPFNSIGSSVWNPNPTIIAVFFGLSYSMAANTSYTLMSQKTSVANQTTLFGIMGVLNNLTSSIFPLIVTALTEENLLFFKAELLLISVGFLSAAAAVFIMFYYKRNHRLGFTM